METLEKPKRKPYRKFKIGGKITVKHYLNKKLKPLLEEGKAYFPVYTYVMVKGQLARFKSKTNLIATQEELNGNIWNEEIKKALNQEIEDITTTIIYLKPFENESFKIAEFTEFYDKLHKPFWGQIDEQLRAVVRVEFDRYIAERIISGEEDLRRLYAIVLDGINWKSDVETITIIISYLFSDFVNQVKSMFLTPYLFEFSNLQKLSGYDYGHLEVVDYQSGRYQEFVLNLLGNETGQQFLKDIDKAVLIHKVYKKKNF